MLVAPLGCTLLFYETYGKGSPEQETLPSYALLAEDGIVQAVPEHPKKENVFCLSNAYGDVYLFQVGLKCENRNHTTRCVGFRTLSERVSDLSDINPCWFCN